MSQGTDDLFPDSLPSDSLAPRLSLSGLARSFNRSREFVRARLQAAGVEPAHDGRYLLSVAIPALTTEPDRQRDPAQMTPFERAAHYKAEWQLTQVQAERRELLSSLEVEQMFAGLFKAIAEFFDTLPDVIERDCGASPMVIAKIEDVLDAQRERLFNISLDVAAQLSPGEPGA